MVNLIALKDKILIKYISCNEIPATFIKCTMFLFKYKYSETLFAFPRVKFVLPKITPLLKSSQLPKTSLECYIKRRNSHDQESYKSWGMVTKHYTSFEKKIISKKLTSFVLYNGYISDQQFVRLLNYTVKKS